MNKYIYRFLITFGVALPILLIAGTQALQVALYKIAMVAVGVALAELIWAVGFKPYFGSMDVNAKLSFVLFRAIFYGSIILACALGL